MLYTDSLTVCSDKSSYISRRLFDELMTIITTAYFVKPVDMIVGLLVFIMRPSEHAALRALIVCSSVCHVQASDSGKNAHKNCSKC